MPTYIRLLCPNDFKVTEMFAAAAIFDLAKYRSETMLAYT